jgi:hypothetical protein
MARNIVQWLFGLPDDNEANNREVSEGLTQDEVRDLVRERREIERAMQAEKELRVSNTEWAERMRNEERVNQGKARIDDTKRKIRERFGDNSNQSDESQQERAAENKGRWSNLTDDGRIGEWDNNAQAYIVDGKRYDADGNAL